MNVVDQSRRLRAVVLDHLAHHGYTSTAAAFARESALDDLVHFSPDEAARIHHCKQIYHHIQSGRVDQATLLLNSHFPAVLARRSQPPPTPYACPTSTAPHHLALNLRVLAFIEACRTRPLHYPPNPEQQGPPPHPDYPALLNMAKNLLAHVQILPSPADRKIYRAELQNVAGLLAYSVPEESPMKNYLAQERRDAVADQIHRAIMESLGRCSISSLELLVRYTESVWYFANKIDVKPRPGIILPPASSTKEPETVPIFDLGLFLDQKT
ncbi:hypothetical protein C0995_003768 [Termitomyces sp. Mi166|nr:hypothetical protein C0995_003768 [Termitomyces sp. Mi166\